MRAITDSFPFPVFEEAPKQIIDSDENGGKEKSFLSFFRGDFTALIYDIHRIDGEQRREN